MIRVYAFICLFLSQFACLGGFGDSEAKTRVSLQLSVSAIQPGQTFLAAVQFELREGWHSYWRFPGESGAAPSIDWKLPAGVTVGQILWPTPQKLVEEGIVTYIYSQEVALLVPITVSNSVSKGSLDLSGEVEWIECKSSCVSEKSAIAATLIVGDQGVLDPTKAKLFQKWESRLPPKQLPFEIHPKLQGTADKPRLTIEIPKTDSIPDFFPYPNEACEVAHVTDILTNANGSLVLSKEVSFKGNQRPDAIEGLLILNSTNQSQGYSTRLVLNQSPPDGTKEGRSLLAMLMYAFLGGLILNAMPCVLPVIALKILGFIGQGNMSASRTRLLGFVYGFGVVVSFVVLAVVAILVKQAGHLVGWGMQFGNPQFLVVLTLLVLLVALNLFGLFEVTLSGRTMETAGGLASKEGAAGAFMNGVLAVALATPCTAPYLGAALGFAFLQTPAVIVSIFIAAGLGLAFPYVLLSWNPGWLKHLPKPGSWMEKLKIAFGFPMLATAMWLFILAANHYGKQVLWLGLFLITVAMAAWVFGEFFQRGRSHRALALAAALGLAVAGYIYALEFNLHWRSQTQPDPTPAVASQDGIPWQPWSAEKVEQARAQGRPVFVDFTADWCLTCQVNKKTSIETSAVREKLKSMNAVALIGDYTRTPDAITRELNRFQRAGVPLVIVYPKDAAKPPLVLPELLTPQIVLNALDEAAR